MTFHKWSDIKHKSSQKRRDAALTLLLNQGHPMTNEEFNTLLAEVSNEFPDFKLLPKAGSAYMRFLNSLLGIVTLGAASEFMTGYNTTVGNTIYTPSSWDTKPLVERAVEIRHERTHMRQARKYGRIGFSLLYLFVFLPIGLAYFRARFEFEAYVEQMHACREYGLPIDNVFREHVISKFTSPIYGWMFPFRTEVSLWYDRAFADMERQHEMAAIDAEIAKIKLANKGLDNG